VISDDFEVILDRCLADVTAGRATIESCLRNYPVYAKRLGASLKIAAQAQAVLRPAPLAADKRRALESRLLRRAGQLRPKPALRPTAPARRRGVALAWASFIVVFLLLGSAVSVSAASVPGDFLYPVKRAAEQVRLKLTSEQQQLDLYLEFARQRLQELSVLTDRGEVSEDLLAEMSGNTALMLERLPALPQQEQQALLTSLTNFQDQQLQVLEDMASSVQGDARAAVMAALADSTAKRQRAAELLAGAASDNNPTDGDFRGSHPTIVAETRTPQGHPAVKPESTDTAEPQVTPRATRVSPSNSQKSTPGAEHTSPGQARQSTPHSPPGQAKQPPPPPPEKPTKAPNK
jgi:hypothetical protein